MKRLDKYLSLEFSRIYVLSATALVVIGLVGTLVDNLGDYLRLGYGFSEILRIFLWMVPVIFVQFSPLAVLMAVLIGLGLMGKNRETLVMEGSGLNPVRFLIPFFCVSVFLAAACFAVNETIMPASFGRIKPQPQISSPTIALPGLFLYAENYLAPENAFHKPNILLFRDDGSLREVYQGKILRISGEGNWIIESGRRVSFSPEGLVADENSFRRRVVDFGVNREEVNALMRPVETLSYQQLSGYLKRLSAAGLAPAAVRTAALSHFSYPLLNIFVIFLAFPLLFSRRFSRPLLITIGFLLAIFTYWFFSFSLALGKQGYLPAPLAAFLPHVVIFISAVFFRRA